MDYITNEQLFFCIQRLHPDLVPGRDYLIARNMLPESGEPAGHAYILQWMTTTVPMPHVELLYADWENLRGDYELWLEAAEVRAQRDKLLAESDVSLAIARGANDLVQVSALEKYQAELRDVPQQPGFPAEVTWPQLKTTVVDTNTAADVAWERIKAERDRRAANGVKVGAHWFHSDGTSRIQWLGTKDSARDQLAAGEGWAAPVRVAGVNLIWKTRAGGYVPVDLQLAFDVVEATKVLDMNLFAIAETKRVEMINSGDPAHYDALAGWPVTFGEE